jgi:hypothetical protein
VFCIPPQLYVNGKKSLEKAEPVIQARELAASLDPAVLCWLRADPQVGCTWGGVSGEEGLL